MINPGLNVWFDLMTTDTAAAARFYAEVIGWRTELWKDGDPSMPYIMWITEDGPIGGMLPLPEEAKQMGAPPHWLAYTTVEDVDATATRCTALGGRIYKPGFDVPKVGRVAILADPQGAVFAVYTPEGEMQLPAAEKHGRFSWAELNTTDWQSAWKFYRELFGWKERGSSDMGEPVGTYFMFNDPTERTRGGMSNVAKQMGFPPHWTYYITVSDIEATLERVRQSGGKVLMGPVPIPGDDTIAQCQDPQGAIFAVYQSGRAG